MNNALTAAAPVSAEPEFLTQRAQTRELLSLRWRQQVGHVTDLAVRRHSLDDTDPKLDRLIRVLDAELDEGRRLLVEIEAALMSVPLQSTPLQASGVKP